MQGVRLSAYAEAQAAADLSAAEMQGERLSAYAEARTDAAIRELKGSASVKAEQPFRADVIRELKGSAPVDVNDYLSPLQGGTSTPTPTRQPSTVDDYLSPLGGGR
jgi:hypothetical protein